MQGSIYSIAEHIVMSLFVKNHHQSWFDAHTFDPNLPLSPILPGFPSGPFRDKTQLRNSLTWGLSLWESVCVFHWVCVYEFDQKARPLTLTPFSPGVPGGPSFPFSPVSPFSPLSPSWPMSPLSPWEHAHKNMTISFFKIMQKMHISLLLYYLLPSYTN